MNDKIIGASGYIKISESDRGETVIDIDPTYGGQPSISTVGSVTIGNWTAAPVPSAHGGTGLDNHGFTIAVDGNLYVSGPLTIECEQGSIVSLPEEGRLVNRVEALDPAQNLKDCYSTSDAYDNIAPVGGKGDIVVFDGESNWPLVAGADNQVLWTNSEKGLGLEWRNLPSFYSTIKHNGKYLEKRDALHFWGSGLVVQDQCEATQVRLSRNLEALADVNQAGFLVHNPRYKEDGASIETCLLREGTGISISGNGSQDQNWDPVIGIDPTYLGQESIQIVGSIREGEWEAGTIGPEFGGTGCINEDLISIGGDFTTSCMVMIGDPLERASSIIIDAQGDTEITLPTNGTLATEECSLQTRHNLGDVGNPTEAFRNISPTKARGDLIVRGYGDYDTRVAIGAPGDVLVVDYGEPTGVKWEARDTKSQINKLVKKHVKRHLAAQVAPTEDCHQVAGMPVEQVIEAILMQFDMLSRIGMMKPLKELRQVLEQWGKSKHKK